ncbi:YhcH/YjgK/YiaL family protein, partial [Prevotella histicola]|uniref:YhcH/YjgK/YiaL family protein n=1 Tax=Prevotella histicola TaxID=470565 RepID=UPI00241C8ECE
GTASVCGKIKAVGTFFILNLSRTQVNLLGNPDIAYDSEKDCGFYKRSGHEYFKVKPGQFTIFFPEDAHAPIIGEGRQKKLVAKIKV